MKRILGCGEQLVSVRGGGRRGVPKLVALAFFSLFLVILLINSLQASSNVVSLQYYPTVTKPGEPFEVTATITNPAASPRPFLVEMYVNGLQVLNAKSTLGVSGSQAFTYTRLGSEIGSSTRVYAQVTDLATGRVYTQVVSNPPAPPELLLSFASFSSFATSLFSSSSSSMASTITIAYYESAVGAVAPKATLVPSTYLAIVVSLTLIALVVFLELTDSAYGRLGSKFQLLRTRFGLFGFSMLLVFAGIVFTRVVILIVG